MSGEKNAGQAAPEPAVRREFIIQGRENPDTVALKGPGVELDLTLDEAFALGGKLIHTVGVVAGMRELKKLLAEKKEGSAE